MQEYNKSEDIIKVIWANKVTVIVLVIIASVLSYGATFLIEPKYKSTSIVFPANMFPTSEESNTEQLLQYFNSDDVKNELAKKHNLYEYYGVDTINEKNGKALFDYVYKESILISPTLYESIEITVKDKSPAHAQLLNRSILDITNNLIRQNKKYLLKQYLTNIDQTIAFQNNTMDSLLKVAKLEGIDNLSTKSKDESDDLKKINKLKQKELSEKVKGLAKSYSKVIAKRDMFYLDYTGDITFFSLVSKPTLTDKRCYPVRSLIVSVSAISTLLLSIILIMLRNRFSNKNV